MKQKITTLILLCIIYIGGFSQTTYSATKQVTNFLTSTTTQCQGQFKVRINRDYTRIIFTEPDGIQEITVLPSDDTFGIGTRCRGHIEDNANAEIRVNLYSKGPTYYVIEYETKTDKFTYNLKKL